ncbi:calcium-binding protein [Novosphingobium huizhouense]|uniref:calcium-binding protein n=1 Tax=Novosphingobium huizhouense TaxID=2866625 RepID=UPI001CD8D262|nr:calcium-binding protein [Novosphingobium huizhouense]
MAKFTAFQAFNMLTLDLSSLITDGTSQSFLDNANITLNGVNYQDLAGFEYYDNGYFAAVFGGTGFVVSKAGTPTAGTVTGIAEFVGPLSAVFSPNPNLPPQGAFLLQGVSLPVTSLVAAALTLPTSDDLALFQTALSGADTITLSGGADVFKGFDGDDVLNGNAGADKLYGGNGADKLFGGAGNDTLFGDAGADKLYGGAGKDILTGGDGADAFVFNTSAVATSADVIKDFSHAQGDHIDLAAGIFRGIGQAAGTTLSSDAFFASSAFNGNVAAHDATDRILYDQVTGKLYYDADGNGAASAPVLLATLGTTTHPTLVAADIHIIA